MTILAFPTVCRLTFLSGLLPSLYESNKSEMDTAKPQQEAGRAEENTSASTAKAHDRERIACRRARGLSENPIAGRDAPVERI